MRLRASPSAAPRLESPVRRGRGRSRPAMSRSPDTSTLHISRLPHNSNPKTLISRRCFPSQNVWRCLPRSGNRVSSLASEVCLQCTSLACQSSISRGARPSLSTQVANPASASATSCSISLPFQWLHCIARQVAARDQDRGLTKVRVDCVNKNCEGRIAEESQNGRAAGRRQRAGVQKAAQG